MDTMLSRSGAVGEHAAGGGVSALARALGDSSAASPLDPATALERALRVADQIGITRLAEIGLFLDRGVHVYQATRTSLFHPTAVGMNTGSQGKGYTPAQAKISAIMESAEAFSAEPRAPRLVRGSFRELSQVHAVLDPRALLAADPAEPASPDETMMWTPALALPHRREVLVPADVAYCCLFQSAYGGAAHFPASSNGLGAGFDHPTAVRQALLEVLERHYARHLERLEVGIEALVTDGPVRAILERHGDAFLEAYDVQLLAVTAPRLAEQLPFVFCVIGGQGRAAVGYGIGLDPLAAVRSAHAEAFQSLVTTVSGAREDLGHGTPLFAGASARRLRRRYARVWPRRRTLAYADWAARWAAPLSSGEVDARSDIDRLTTFLARIGHPLVVLADLSRAGVDAKVVRAIVPGLLPCFKYQAYVPRPWTFAALEAARFREVRA